MIELIPAIDIIGGHCVRLSQGDYDKMNDYCDSPVSMAEKFEKHGFRRLHVVDLDGARCGKVVNIAALKEMTTHTTLSVDFGGGIKSEQDLQEVFQAGATAVTIGSLAVNAPETLFAWIDKYGAERFILSADTRDGVVRTGAWTENTGITVSSLIAKYWEKGIRRVLCTDISRDGMLCGANVELYKDILHEYPDCELIASGGISSVEDIDTLDKAGIPAVVFGKAIYEGRIDLNVLTERIKERADKNDE